MSTCFLYFLTLRRRTVSLAPSIVGASIAVFDLLSESTELRDKLMNNVAHFKKGIAAAGFDYKDGDFLMQFVNEQGKILPRRITGNSLKYQRKVSTAVKRARHLAILPYVTDLLK